MYAEDALIDHKKALPFSLAALLRACSKRKDLVEGRQLHSEIHRYGLLQTNTSLGNLLLTMYTKCGALSEAKKVFFELPIRNVVSWNILIAGFNQNGQPKKALAFFDWMRHEGVPPDFVTYLCALKACGITKEANRGQQIHNEILDCEALKSNVAVGNAVIDMYAKCGMLSKAQQVFDELLARDVVSWNTLLTGYIHSGQGKHAYKQYERMKEEGESPDAFTYTCILGIVGMLKKIDEGRKIHQEIARKGYLESSHIIGNALVDMYAKFGALLEAHQVLDNLNVRNVVAWSALLVGYSQNEKGKETLECYDHMQVEGLSADAFIYSCVLKACALTRSIDRGKQVHEEIVKRGLLSNNVVLGTAVVDMYCKCGLLSIAAQVHEKLPTRNVVSWSALISGYTQQGDGEQALECYQQMRKEGMHPDMVTYACILKACGITNEIGRGKQIHDEIASEYMLDKSAVLGSALVDMYAKCGVLTQAARVLKELPICNVVSWNALIAGYAQHGKGQEALDCIQQMRNGGLTPNRVSWNAIIGGYAQQGDVDEAFCCFHWMQHEGITPDSITFLSLLSACSHSGRIHEGITYFEDMKRNHGLTPHIEHHTCLIDLFCRTGHFDKAITVLRKVPSNNYLPVWSALLGACQKWGNLKLGRYAFDQVTHLDEGNPI